VFLGAFELCVFFVRGLEFAAPFGIFLIEAAHLECLLHLESFKGDCRVAISRAQLLRFGVDLFGSVETVRNG
jgi:hypothetical protein